MGDFMGNPLQVHGFVNKHLSNSTTPKKLTSDQFLDKMNDILKTGLKRGHDVGYMTDEIFKLVQKNPGLAKENKIPADYLEIKNKVVLPQKEAADVSQPQKTQKKESKNISEQGVHFLKEYESFSSTLYDKDGARNATIGYGHLVHKGKINGSASEAPFKNGITKEKAEALLKQDAQRAVDVVKNTIKVPLTQNQFDALVSMAFNYGKLPKNLTKLVNEGCTDPKKITAAFGEVRRSGGQIVRGLVNRRADEAELFLNGDYKRSHF